MSIFDKKVVLIRDEQPLLEYFIPESVTHRDGQKQELAECLRPVTVNRKPRNAFLYGPCGTGKTLLVQWLLRELEGHTSRARTAYVNCWKRNTTHAALTEILSQLDIYVNYRQAATDLLKLLEKEAAKKQVVVCLDEVDSLETSELLYDLSRSGVGLVLVSNDAYAMVDMDPRIKSSVNAEGIEFPMYTDEEVFGIVKVRAKYGLVPGAAKENDLKTIARLSNGDARIAIETLRRAALVAEDKEQERITGDDVKKAFGSTGMLRRSDALKKLNEHEQALYQLMEKHKKIGTKELWEKYVKADKKPASQRSYRNYMNHLARLGLIKAKGELTGREYELAS
ncbi:MAG: AAA family ATPase [Candidatus Diapherotrites archaeon]|nr:AAA family ATPase [Candidatus Diapherotrites archaeon]